MRSHDRRVRSEDALPSDCDTCLLHPMMSFRDRTHKSHSVGNLSSVHTSFWFKWQINIIILWRQRKRNTNTLCSFSERTCFILAVVCVYPGKFEGCFHVQNGWREFDVCRHHWEQLLHFPREVRWSSSSSPVLLFSAHCFCDQWRLYINLKNQTKMHCVLLLPAVCVLC